MSGVQGGWGQPIPDCTSRPSAHLDLSFLEILAVSLINEALDQGSPKKTLSALLLPSAGLDNVSLAVAPRYHLLLVAAKRQKAQVRAGVSGLVAGAGRASPVGRAVPRMHPGRAQSDDPVPSGGGGRRGHGAGGTSLSSSCQHAGNDGALWWVDPVRGSHSLLPCRCVVISNFSLGQGFRETVGQQDWVLPLPGIVCAPYKCGGFRRKCFRMWPGT